jgi:hypothetical protein
MEPGEDIAQTGVSPAPLLFGDDYAQPETLARAKG